MWFSVQSTVLALAGLLLILLSPKLVPKMVPLYSWSWMEKAWAKLCLLYLPICIIGVMCIAVGLLQASSGPPRSFMNNDVNRLALLDNAAIADAVVVKSFYSSGWEVVYKFPVSDKQSSAKIVYWGSAKGPKKYYAHLSTGDPLTVLYNPANPKINCEIRYFCNNPSYRESFSKAGRLPSLTKYDKICSLEDYTLTRWAKEEHER